MKKFLLLVSFAGLCLQAAAQHAEKAARQFLHSLDTAQLAKAQFAWDDAERFN